MRCKCFSCFFLVVLVFTVVLGIIVVAADFVVVLVFNFKIGDVIVASIAVVSFVVLVCFELQ